MTMPALLVALRSSPAPTFWPTDGAITLNTIYFIPELDLAFAELARVTKSSGRVVIGLGDPDAMAGTPLTQHNFRLRPLPRSSIC
jgi:hypothetical protein